MCVRRCSVCLLDLVSVWSAITSGLTSVSADI